MSKSCKNCHSFSEQYDCEDHHVTASWVECSARKGVENLRQFPFQNTQCADYRQRAIAESAP